MAIITLKSFDELVEDLIFVVRSSTDKLTDFNIGSVNLAYLEAIGLAAQYLGGLLEELEEAFYIESATNENLDRRLGDFELTRTEGVKATGLLHFYSFASVGSDVVIPIGTVGKTPKDTNGDFVEFVTTEEITLYSGTAANLLSRYETSGTGEATIIGPIGNVGAERITELDTDITGISGITNLIAFTGGQESESDEAFRERGRLYLQSLAKGTKAALKAAILGLADVNNVDILDWNDVDPFGPSPIAPGMIRIIVDSDNATDVAVIDEITLGTNTITKEVQIDIWNLIKDDVKAAGVGVEFEQTTLVPINIVLNLSLVADSDITQTQTIDQATFNTLYYSKIQQYFNSLVVNEDIRWSKISSLADSINGVVGVDDTTLIEVDPLTLIPDPSPVVHSNIVLIDNKKGILGTVTVNGSLIP